jgi:hypothetical protein
VSVQCYSTKGAWSLARDPCRGPGRTAADESVYTRSRRLPLAAKETKVLDRLRCRKLACIYGLPAGPERAGRAHAHAWTMWLALALGRSIGVRLHERRLPAGRPATSSARPLLIPTPARRHMMCMQCLYFHCTTRAQRMPAATSYLITPLLASRVRPNA